MGNLQEYTRNRLSKTVGPSSISTSYTYDKADELQTVGGTTYTVNADGNLTAAGSSSFGYDQANRLIGATVDGHASSYTCDGDGKRASRTTHGVTTPYTWDVVGALPNVLSDGTLKYVYGLGLAYTMDGSNNIQVFQTDGLGSVRAITNSGGSVIQTFQTDEFGVPTLTQGTNTEPFRYSGQPRRALRHDPLAPNGFDGIFDVVDELALAEERAFNVVDVRLVSPGPR
jgi:YD repeat-containing protein